MSVPSLSRSPAARSNLCVRTEHRRLAFIESEACDSELNSGFTVKIFQYVEYALFKERWQEG